jgi:hypothetical protein
MRYSVTLERGGWVVWDTISRETVTRPATSEETQEAVKEWNARCVTRRVDPPIKVDGWGTRGRVDVLAAGRGRLVGVGPGQGWGPVDPG